MKNLILLLFPLFLAFYGRSQTILNGDFENNGADTCIFNLDNIDFNALVENAVAFGPNDELDIQRSNCGYAASPSNEWFVSLSKRPTGDYDAFSLALSEALIAGNTYEITYWELAVDTFGNGNIPLHFGISTEPDEFGDEIYSSLPPIDTWAQRSFSFVAPNDGSFFTVKIEEEGTTRAWNFVDDFKIVNLSSATQEGSNIASILIYPNPTSGFFSVALPIEAEKVNIFNAAGQLVQSREIGKLSEIDFDLETNGVYIVQVITKAGIMTRKVVVDK